MSSNDQATTASANVTKKGDREITTERYFAAPPERVYAAWTDPDLISKWWGLDSSETVVEEMDVRLGGAWRFTEKMEDGETGFRGVYREIVPGKRLAQTFEWDGMPGRVSVDTITFEADGDGTRATSHTIFHYAEERDGMVDAGMQNGLEQSYAQLDRLLAEGS
jgi:uncharacterized protein YndB with AHSA1/START domain